MIKRGWNVFSDQAQTGLKLIGFGLFLINGTALIAGGLDWLLVTIAIEGLVIGLGAVILGVAVATD